MNRAERNVLDAIGTHLAATDPELADLLTDGPREHGGAAGSALLTATVGLVVLVAGFLVSSGMLTVVGLVVMVVMPAPVASGLFPGIVRTLRGRPGTRRRP